MTICGTCYVGPTAFLKYLFSIWLVQLNPNSNKCYYLCPFYTQNVYFCFGDDIYQQNDGVTMGSPLGPVLTGIFMVELETKVIPTVIDSIYHWRRYADDTFIFIKKVFVEHVLAHLNSFHKNIQFIYELENQIKLLFFDVLLICRTKSATTVYRKSTNSDI